MFKFWMIALCLFSTWASANSGMKVMTFNTMCFLCGKKAEFGTFKQRVRSISETIKRHDPDLLSLQEMSFKGEVKDLLRKLNSVYTVLHHRSPILSYVDPVLMVRKSRYDVLNQGSFWLGPKKNSPLGWKVTLPRRFHWAELYDKKSKQTFIFSGTHFDNSTENKTNSSLVVNDFLNRFNHPVIFAGDTNLKTTMEGYDILLVGLFNDTYPGLEKVTFFSNGPYSIHDACNVNKAPTFPLCRIDHVLTSRNSPWKTKSWGVDVYKYHGSQGFASDHRAVIVELD